MRNQTLGFFCARLLTCRVHHQLRSTEVFAAESEKEMLEWIEAIRQVIVFMALKQEGGSQIQINELVRSASTSSGLVPAPASDLVFGGSSLVKRS